MGTAKTLNLVDTLCFLHKSVSNFLFYKCNIVFSFACGRFKAVSYPHKSN